MQRGKGKTEPLARVNTASVKDWTTHGGHGSKLLFGPLFDIDPLALIDQPIKIWWDGEGKFFPGKIVSFDSQTWKHKVLYDDGDVTQELLVLQTVQFPKVPEECPSEWRKSSASQLESLGAVLATEAEKAELDAKSKAEAGTKRSKDAANGGDLVKQLWELVEKVLSKAELRQEELTEAAGPVAVQRSAATRRKASSSDRPSSSNAAGPSVDPRSASGSRPLVNAQVELPHPVLTAPDSAAAIASPRITRSASIPANSPRCTSTEVAVAPGTGKRSRKVAGGESLVNNQVNAAQSNRGQLPAVTDKGNKCDQGSSGRAAKRPKKGLKPTEEAVSQEILLPVGPDELPEVVNALQCPSKQMPADIAASKSANGSKSKKSSTTKAAPHPSKAILALNKGPPASQASTDPLQPSSADFPTAPDKDPSASSIPPKGRSKAHGPSPKAKGEPATADAPSQAKAGTRQMPQDTADAPCQSKAVGTKKAPLKIILKRGKKEAKGKTESVDVAVIIDGSGAGHTSQAVIGSGAGPSESVPVADVTAMCSPPNVPKKRGGVGKKALLNGRPPTVPTAEGGVGPSDPPAVDVAGPSAGPTPGNVLHERRSKIRAGMMAAIAAATDALASVSPEEAAYRSQLPHAAFPNGGGRCFPVHCNGNPGLLCLPRDTCLAIHIVCCCQPCQDSHSHEQRFMRSVTFEAHSGLGQSKKPKHSVKMLAGIRVAGSPNYLISLGEWMESIQWPFLPMDPEEVYPAVTGPEADALEAEAAAAAENGLSIAPRAPRTSVATTTIKRKKGYVLLPDGETVGPSSEPLPSIRQKRNPVRLSYDDEGVMEGVALAWKRRSKQRQSHASSWGGDMDVMMQLGGEPEDGEGGGVPRESGAAGGSLVDISRFYQESPDVLEWIKGVPNEAASERFRVWNERLGGVISDTPLPNMPVGARLVPIKEAVKILRNLERHPVCLKLLEDSQVSRAVAMLRSHRDLRVAQRANAVVASWRTLASNALQRAEEVLGGLPKTKGGYKPRGGGAH